MQKQGQFQNASGSNPTAKNSNAGSQRDILHAPTKLSGRRDNDVQNILINSNQSKSNTFQASMSSKSGVYNNSKLGAKMSQSSPTKKSEPTTTAKATNKNIVSFQ